MENFIFNGKHSYNDLGIVVKKMPSLTKAAKDIESIKVNGRNGNLHIDNGTYNSYTETIECVVMDLSKIDLIKKTLDGEGILKISTNPNRVYNVIIKNQIPFDKYLGVLREFPLQLEIEPFSYSEELKSINKNESGVFEIQGNVNTPPNITVSGVGTITVNNKSIQVLESDITIDCELMNCTKNLINKNDQVILQDFPILIPGENSITLGVGITNVKIEYRERWL